MSSFTREQLENWLKTIDVKAINVLDVGGAQLPVRGRTKSWDVKNYTINDLEEPHQDADSAQVENGLMRAIGSIEGILSEEFKEIYDVMFCLEVMEYILNPVKAIENMARLLKVGGILYISFPFIYPHHNPAGKDFLRYTRWAVEALLKDFDIEITPRKEVLGLEVDYSLNTWYHGQKMRPSKEYAGHNEVGYLVKAIKR